MKKIILIIMLLISPMAFGQSLINLLSASNIAVEETTENWYVDRDASGNDDGTSWTDASPTLSGLAWGSISGGDTVYISGGSDSTLYLIQAISNKGTFSPELVITKGIDAGHTGEVIISNSDTGELWSFIINNTSNIKVNSITFKSDAATDTTQNNRIVLINASDNIQIDNCNIVSDGHADGIYADNADFLSITNNTIEVLDNSYPNSQDCLQIYLGVGGHTITGNTIIMRGAGELGSTYAHKDIVQFGVVGDDANYETVIANNFLYYNSNYAVLTVGGLYLNQSKSSRYLIYNNIIATNTSDMMGIYIVNLEADTAYNVSARIFNNTVLTGSSPVGMGLFVSFLDTLIMKNNIFSVDSVTANNKGVISFTEGGSIFSDIGYVDIDYNHYYKGEPYPGQLFRVDEDSSTLNLGEWRAYYGGYDANGDTGSVSFANRWGTDIADYLTTTGRDAGVDLSAFFTVDINDSTRPYNSVWDFGAIEYDSSVDTAGVSALLADGDTKGWYTLYTMTKDANDKVTSWTDSSGNGNHIVQADTSKSPTWTSSEVIFDGVDDYMDDAFTLVQPITIYAVIEQREWAQTAYAWDGDTGVKMVLFGTTGSPNVSMYAGAEDCELTTWTVGAYATLTCIYDGASSSIQKNDDSPITGCSIGTDDPAGFTLGSHGGQASYRKITVKEIILRSASDSGAEQDLIRAYLNDRYTVY